MRKNVVKKYSQLPIYTLTANGTVQAAAWQPRCSEYRSRCTILIWNIRAAHRHSTLCGPRGTRSFRRVSVGLPRSRAVRHSSAARRRWRRSLSAAVAAASGTPETSATVPGRTARTVPPSSGRLRHFPHF